MNKNVDKKTKFPDLDLLPDIFRDYPDIDTVYLFGSVAQESVHEDSDLDLGVVVQHSPSKLKRMALLKDLARSGFCNVDCVYLDTKDIVLKFEAIRMNKVIYRTDNFDSAAYYSKILRQYFDFLPYLDVQRKALKERILGR